MGELDMANTENDIKKIEKREENIENIIFEYLTKNRFFKEEELLEKLESLIQERVNNRIRDYKSILIKDKKTEEDIDIYLKHEKESLLKKERDNIINFSVPRIARKNRILLEPHINSEKIVILREKEAEFFVLIFQIFKPDRADYISKDSLKEAENFLNIKEELNNLINDEILIKTNDGGILSQIDCISRSSNIYENVEIEKMIFTDITIIRRDKELKRIIKRINESNIKIDESNKKIEEIKIKIRNFNGKIIKTEEKIEKGKIDTVSLLGIFVAIISIIYANISVAMSDTLSSVIITNVSTVACIFFLLAYVEVFIKNQNEKNKLRSYGWSLIAIIALVINIWFYKKIQYDKNNFIKYMENIYELKNKETAFLELQHFTMPSDY